MTTPASNLPEITPPASAPGAQTAKPESLWVRRLWLGIRVVFFIQIGMMLVVLPWTILWSQNSLLASNVRLHDFFNHGFVRGAVSGLGIVNLWIGIADAVTYRE